MNAHAPSLSRQEADNAIDARKPGFWRQLPDRRSSSTHAVVIGRVEAIHQPGGAQALVHWRCAYLDLR
jgi:hypothetical protein